jgi:hypothetical protein
MHNTASKICLRIKVTNLTAAEPKGSTQLITKPDIRHDPELVSHPYYSFMKPEKLRNINKALQNKRYLTKIICLQVYRRFHVAGPSVLRTSLDLEELGRRQGSNDQRWYERIHDWFKG